MIRLKSNRTWYMGETATLDLEQPLQTNDILGEYVDYCGVYCRIINLKPTMPYTQVDLIPVKFNNSVPKTDKYEPISFIPPELAWGI